MKHPLRVTVGLVIACGLYAVVKKGFIPFQFGTLSWTKQSLLQLEVFLLVIVAGSVIITELVHLAHATTANTPSSPHPVGWKDVATLLLSLFASLLLLILTFAIARYFGVELPDR